MAAMTHAVRDDSRFFERALQEYRETVGDYSNFLDLRLETQQQVIVRAQQLEDECGFSDQRAPQFRGP